MEALIIEHYMTGRGKYPANPSGLKAYFGFYSEAWELWQAYGVLSHAGVAVQALIRPEKGRKIFLPESGENIYFDSCKVYNIFSIQEKGAWLIAPSHPRINVYFDWVDLVPIYFDFDFHQFQ